MRGIKVFFLKRQTEKQRPKKDRMKARMSPETELE